MLLLKKYVYDKIADIPNIDETSITYNSDEKYAFSEQYLLNKIIQDTYDKTDSANLESKLKTKLDISSFIVNNSLPGIPILDRLKLAIISDLSLVSINKQDMARSLRDPVNNLYFLQENDDKNQFSNIIQALTNSIYTSTELMIFYLLKITRLKILENKMAIHLQFFFRINKSAITIPSSLDK